MQGDKEDRRIEVESKSNFYFTIGQFTISRFNLVQPAVERYFDFKIGQFTISQFIAKGQEPRAKRFLVSRKVAEPLSLH